MATAQRPTQVVYVGGTGRSGSTVLAGVLGELPGFLSVGEVRFLWQRGILQDRLCGCGEHFSGCAWWGEVLDLALGPSSAAARARLAHHLHEELSSRTRLRTLPGHVAGHRSHVSLRPDGELEHVLGRVYAAIAEVGDAQVVVDSSKLPTYAALLGGLETVDPHVVHLLRDPRAAAYSWRRLKQQPDLGEDGLMERRGAWKSALLWTVWNRSLEAMTADLTDRYVRVTYEAFLAQPRAEVERILDTFGMSAEVRPVFSAPSTVWLSANHTVAGNPARHDRGPVSLVADDEWIADMRPSDRRAVTALTLPTLRRYGYRAAG